MVDVELTHGRLEQLTARRAGVLAALLGVALALLYPVSVLLRNDAGHAGLPTPGAGYIGLASAVLGPLLLTVGVFGLRHRSYRPLTERRSLLAPLLSLLVSTAGIGAYTAEWRWKTPAQFPPDNLGEGPQTIQPSVMELVGAEADIAHLFALAATVWIVVGAVTARRGWLAGLATAVPPAAGLALAFTRWWPYDWSAFQVAPAVAVLSATALAVGYLAANPN